MYNDEIRPDQRPAKKRGLGGVVFIGLIVIVAVLGLSTFKRVTANAEVAKWTQDQAVRSVSIVNPKTGDAGELILPARLEAWAQAPVYARTNGYLKSWSADIGAKVTQGQVLAEIDTPEVDHQLASAKAALAKVIADRDLAKKNAGRTNSLEKIDAIPRQLADQNRSNLQSLDAQVSQAQAEIARLQTLTDFKRLVAPFDGTVTSRSTDVGALIDTTNSATPLFTVADTSKLRLYVNVPETYASSMQQGLTADFSIPESPDQKYQAVVDNTSGAIDANTGTMLVQLTVDNKDGVLKPGSYAQLNFKLAQGKPILRIPSSALVFNKDGLTVAVLDNGSKALIKPVHIGRDFGSEIEITDGLNADDQVIDSPPDSLASGDPVKPLVVADKPAEKPAAK